VRYPKAYRHDIIIIGLIILCLIIHFRNLFSDIFDYDSSLYAEVAREIYRGRDFLHLTQNGQPFLDKPHLFFWLSAISYSIFGVNNFAFKFPSFLGLIGTLISVYRFSRNYYSRSVAIRAVAITASSLGTFLMTSDVRLEMILTCMIMTGIWLFSSYLLQAQKIYLFLSALFFAAAYYAKGAVGFIIPAVAVLPHMLKHYSPGKGVKVLSLLLPLALVFLIPLFVVAYHQFGWPGVRYFAWDHIAGRVSGSAAYNNPDTFFVWHTMLWVVAPWTLYLLAGVVGALRAWMNRATTAILPEVISVCGLLLGLLFLSFSAFQLSYYVYPLIPFAAILAATLAERYEQKKVVKYLQSLINILLIIVAAFVILYITPGSVGYLVIFFILIVLLCYLSWRELFAGTLMAAIMLNFVLSFVFFPSILQYQSGSIAGTYIKETPGEKDVAVLAIGGSYQLAFYSEVIPGEYFNVQQMLKSEKKGPLYVLTSEDGYQQMIRAGLKVSVEKQLWNFRLTKLTIPFLSPSTRIGACDKCYLVKVVHL
jgi:4-amino-4-deoxy-L-arabinose transferase-like glycosyltransferase